MNDVPPDAPDCFSLSPERYPRKLSIDLPSTVCEWFSEMAARTGRCEDELILELLDKALGKALDKKS